MPVGLCRDPQLPAPSSQLPVSCLRLWPTVGWTSWLVSFASQPRVSVLDRTGPVGGGTARATARVIGRAALPGCLRDGVAGRGRWPAGLASADGAVPRIRPH